MILIRALSVLATFASLSRHLEMLALVVLFEWRCARVQQATRELLVMNVRKDLRGRHQVDIWASALAAIVMVTLTTVILSQDSARTASTILQEISVSVALLVTMAMLGEERRVIACHVLAL